MMTERKQHEARFASLVCVVAGLGITEGQTFRVAEETGSVWEICLGGEYRKINKRSGRVQGWKDGPRFRAVCSLN